MMVRREMAWYGMVWYGMMTAANPTRRRVIFTVLLSLGVFAALLAFASAAAGAGDSSEAFMSATFGLSSARTQKRMENSGAVVLNVNSGGQLTMKGTFEYRSAIFTFGFHDKKGLYSKSVYIASSGDALTDKTLYDRLREAYNLSFGRTNERAVQNRLAKGRLMFQNSWKPDKNTIISLSYNPEITNRLPSDSPSARPIHLTYSYTKWTSGA